MGSAESFDTGRRRRRRTVARQPVGAYASYIGRVGALAMALGVGAAVAGLGGTAWADDTAGPGSSEPGQTSAPASSSGADATEAADDATSDLASPQLDRPGHRLPRVIVRGNGETLPGPRHRGTPAPDSAPGRDSGSLSAPDAEPESTPAREINPRTARQSSDRSDDAPAESPPTLPGQDTPAPKRSADAPEPESTAGAVAAASPGPGRHQSRPITGEVSLPQRDDAEDPDTAVKAVPTSVVSQAFTPSGVQRPSTALTLQSVPQLVAAPLLNSITEVVFGLLGAIGINATNGPLPVLPLQPLMGAMDLIRRELERLFVNERPALTYNPAENIVLPDGRIMGTLHPVDPDNTALTFTVTDPGHGEVLVNSDGRFFYTPDPGTTGSDSFFVTVSDASRGSHIHGLSGLLNLVTFGLLGDSGHTYTQPVTVGLERTILASDLFWPVDSQFLPDGRILMANLYGAVVAYDNNTGQLQTETVFTIPPNAEDEYPRVFGMTVDPNFEENGYIYLLYVENGLPDRYERVSRFTITDPSADVLTADLASEFVLLEGDQIADDGHNGGGMRFGPDGKLYVGVGNNDFFFGNYQISNNAQNLSNIYGKILRINSDGTAPTDNPFFDSENPESYTSYIYAYGFRNPFKLTFTPDGQLLVIDAGESTWEEVNNVISGGNYGWPLAEGPCDGIGVASCATPSSYEDPIIAYTHTGAMSSITSVLVYTGSAYGASYQNKVFISDFQGWISAVTCADDFSACSSGLIFDAVAGPTVNLLQGPDGHIYQLMHTDPKDLNGDTPLGELARYA